MSGADRAVRAMMLDEFPHRPGVTTKRTFSNYNEYQQALWEAFEDTYYARAFGFAATRMPRPGFATDEEKFRAWKGKAVAAWANEAKRDSRTRGLTEDDVPENLWRYLYERMVAAQQTHLAL